MNHYLDVFTESARIASIIPFTSEPTFFAMASFGGFDMRLAAGLAVLGGTLGMGFNWAVGRGLLALHRKKSFRVNEYWYAKLQAFFNGYGGAILLLLSWLPLLKFALVAAGFLNVRWWRYALPLLVVGHAAGYGYYLTK